MIRRRLLGVGLGASVIAGSAVAQTSDDDMAEWFAAAMYESYGPASDGNARTSAPTWEKASAEERAFGLRYARMTMDKLGLRVRAADA